MKGKRLALVGRADARGETEYNLYLGQKRAGAVRQYLVERGLQEARVDATSRGEFDATGHDEDSWAEDRRVDVGLAE